MQQTSIGNNKRKNPQNKENQTDGDYSALPRALTQANEDAIQDMNEME
jgi:hypothetical protein